jgi:quinol monooxygenase YgiN
MTISEFALFVLAANVTIDNPSLRTELTHAKSIMQNYTGNSFYFYQQVESPSSVYLFGEWASIDQHVNQFATSPENMAAVRRLRAELRAVQRAGREEGRLPGRV